MWSKEMPRLLTVLVGYQITHRAPWYAVALSTTIPGMHTATEGGAVMDTCTCCIMDLATTRHMEENADQEQTTFRKPMAGIPARESCRGLVWVCNAVQVVSPQPCQGSGLQTVTTTSRFAPVSKILCIVCSFCYLHHWRTCQHSFVH